MSAPVRATHLIAALLVAAAVLFVIGVSAETGEDDHNGEPAAEAVEHSESGEAGEGAESGEAEPADEGEERVLGIDVESPLLVVTAVVVSLLLAALVWRRPTRGALVLVGVVAALFAVVDLAEVAHQLDEDNTGLVVLATAIAVLHAAAAGLAVRQAMVAGPEPAPATR